MVKDAIHAKGAHAQNFDLVGNLKMPDFLM